MNVWTLLHLSYPRLQCNEVAHPRRSALTSAPRTYASRAPGARRMLSPRRKTEPSRLKVSTRLRPPSKSLPGGAVILRRWRADSRRRSRRTLRRMPHGAACPCTCSPAASQCTRCPHHTRPKAPAARDTHAGKVRPRHRPLPHHRPLHHPWRAAPPRKAMAAPAGWPCAGCSQTPRPPSGSWRRRDHRAPPSAPPA